MCVSTTTVASLPRSVSGVLVCVRSAIASLSHFSKKGAIHIPRGQLRGGGGPLMSTVYTNILKFVWRFVHDRGGGVKKHDFSVHVECGWPLSGSKVMY